MDGLLIAHVADAIDRISGGEAHDYDATADYAANLLADPALADAARRFGAQALSQAEFDLIVRRAVAEGDASA